MQFINPLTKTEPINYILTKVSIFNNGISKLKVDFLNSLHIQQAELSRQHLLRKSRLDYEKRRQRLRIQEKHGIHLVNKDGEELGFIPSTRYTYPKHTQQQHNQQHVALKGNYLSTRRPQEHLRQISRDLQTTLPTVAAFVVFPGVGYAFLLMGMLFPRLLLSRQFHTREQRWEFATSEYGDRRWWFNMLSIDYWGSCMMKMPSVVRQEEEKVHLISGGDEYQPDSPPINNIESLAYTKMDAGGPVFNKQSMHILYQLFQQHIRGHQGSSSISEGINQLQSAHLHHLALSNNLTASMLLPKSIRSTFLQTCLQNVYLQSRLITLAEDIIIDDAALIEEGQLDSACIEMTEEEVLDACWLRGLPVGGFTLDYSSTSISTNTNGSREDELYQMRKILTNHLLMMEHIMGKRLKGELVRDSTLQLLVLHLPAIRYGMRKVD